MSITRNPNFVNFSMKLQELGLKNNKFMLEIKDKRVLELNPWDENLTEEEKQIILNEVKNNMWYFLSEVVRIKTFENKLVQMDINLLTAKSLYVLEKGINIYQFAPRCVYSTITNILYMIWKHIKSNSYVMFNAKNNSEFSIYLNNTVSNIICIPDFIGVNLVLTDFDYFDKYADKVDIIYVNGLEYYKKDKIIEIMNFMQNNKNTQIIIDTPIGKDGTYGRKVGDEMTIKYDKFRTKLFDVDNFVDDHEFFCISEPLNKLTSEEKYKYWCIDLYMNDKKTINRELLCKRYMEYEMDFK